VVLLTRATFTSASANEGCAPSVTLARRSTQNVKSFRIFVNLSQVLERRFSSI
jgi:hypothetical protein